MTEHLPATTTNPETPSSGQPLNDKLNLLLMSGDSVVVGPKTAAALRAFAEEPESALVTEVELTTMIGKLAMATAQPKMSRDESREQLKFYWLALRDLPVADLRGAFFELVKSKTFMPRPAEIRTAAIQQGADRRYAKSRARHLVWLHEREWTQPAEAVPPEELRKLLAGVKVGDASPEAGEA